MKSLFVILFSLIINNACALSTNFGKLHFIPLERIHPTQFVIGKASIPGKIKKVTKHFKKGKLTKYLKKKSTPAIIGPDGLYYILDRHHLARAIYESDIPTRYKGLQVQVIASFKNQSFSSFYKFMQSNNYVYLKKTGEVPRRIEELPKKIQNLRNDPYRSLAWIVRERDGFCKETVPFLEFYWAEFFYEQGLNIRHEGDINKEVIAKSLELAVSPLAEKLPGFGHSCSSN